MTEYKTNIIGLDTILNDKLTLSQSGNLIILIKGKPGTGKTTLATQIVYNIACYTKSDVFFASRELGEEELGKLEERFETKNSPKDIKFVYLKNSTGEEDTDKVKIYPTLNSTSTSLEWARNIVFRINQKVKNTYKVAVIDGLNYLGNHESNMFELENLIQTLRKNSEISIIVYEPSHSAFENIDYLADMIFELKG